MRWEGKRGFIHLLGSRGATVSNLTVSSIMGFAELLGHKEAFGSREAIKLIVAELAKIQDEQWTCFPNP